MKYNFFSFKKRKLKVGLALGGGGARGFAHIGVLRAFEEHGITFDFVAGTSAGSILGAMYCAGLSTKQMMERIEGFSIKEIKTSKIPLMPNNPQGLEQVLDDMIENVTFSDLKIPFCAVATDVRTGTEVHLTKGNVAKCVSASCAVPGFFAPVEMGNMLLFDGGLLNNIPSTVPKLFGCDVVIAVDLNKTRGSGSDSDKYWEQVLSSIFIMMKGNSLSGYLNANVMIQPDMKRFKATKIIDKDDMIAEGYKATILKMDEIKRLLGMRVQKKPNAPKQGGKKFKFFKKPKPTKQNPNFLGDA